jgi:hypothetical protein
MRAEVEQAVETLRSVLAAAEPAAEVRRQRDRLNQAFFIVTQANLASAEEEGQVDLAATLAAVLAAGLETVEQGLPPLERLVSRLARTSDGTRRAALLDASPELIGADLAAALRRVAESALASGAADAAEALNDVAAEVDRRRAGST